MLSRSTLLRSVSRRAAVWFAAGALATAVVAADGVAYRVKDIEADDAAQTTLGLAPQVALGATVLAATAPAHFLDSLEPGELWTTDGTVAGTRPLRDLRGQPLREAVALGGGALMVADSPATGYELWWTDGTASGTRLVEDIRPGAASSMPALVGVLGGIAFVAADDGVHGRELWRSDGTVGGTYLLADLRPGAAGSLREWDDPDRAGVTFDGRLLFRADDGVRGPELWRSDGHPDGTWLMKSFVPGAAGGEPRRFQAAAGRLFLVAEDPAHGAELWASDGTGAGTARVADLVPGAVGSSPWPLGKVPGRLVFATGEYPDRTVWASDGTAAGTVPLAAVAVDWEQGRATLGPRVLFFIREIGGPRQLWSSDGTAAGTGLVADVSGGGLHADGALAFFVSKGLWRTDGTAAGTFELGAPCELPGATVAFGDGWIFSCSYVDGPHGWDRAVIGRTDGTVAGTETLVFDRPWEVGGGPASLTARASGVVFRQELDDAGPTLDWGSDGTEAGTVELVYTGAGDFSGFHGGALLPDGELVFPSSADDAGDGQLFRTDGDLISAVGVFDFGNDGASATTRVADTVYFLGSGLWRTDGTAAGTTEIVDGIEGFGLTDVFGTLWLAGRHAADTPTVLWESRGTAATTIAHPLGFAMDSFEPEGLTRLDAAAGSFVFRAAGGLHRYDPAGDVAIRFHTLAPVPPAGWHPWRRAVVGATLYFFDGTSDGGCALWRSDGTVAGTVQVKSTGVAGCWPVEIVAMGGEVYFNGCDVSRGCELWRSDGTAAGTVRITDLDPGIFSSQPSQLAVVGDRLYFAACDPGHGCEPWVTAGIRASTHRLGDVAPGPRSSRLDQWTPALDLVFFRADDGTGAELWAVPREIFYDGFETGDTTRW
ncbi:MAG: hypothetical protein AMXMBFR36_15650 [Acidobacteriota bacterium]